MAQVRMEAPRAVEGMEEKVEPAGMQEVREGAAEEAVHEVGAVEEARLVVTWERHNERYTLCCTLVYPISKNWPSRSIYHRSTSNMDGS